MSMAALRWARAVRGISASAKGVLLLLADMSNDAGECWPCVANVAADACLGERAARYAIRDLEAAGILQTDRGGGRHRSSTYRLAVGAKEAPDADTGHDVPPLSPNKRGHETTKRGHQKTQRGHETTQRGHQMPPNPHNPQEPSRTLILSEPPKARPDAFEAWWTHYPRKVGKDVARTAYAAAIKRGATDADLAAGLQRQQWPDDPQYIPHPRTWLTQGRWQDVPLRQAARPTAGRPGPLAWMAEDMRGASHDPFTIDAEPNQ